MSVVRDDEDSAAKGTHVLLPKRCDADSSCTAATAFAFVEGVKPGRGHGSTSDEASARGCCLVEKSPGAHAEQLEKCQRTQGKVT